MQHPTFGGRARGQSRYRCSPRTSSAIRDAFMARWLEYLPRRGGFVERFNHGYPLRGQKRAGRTLEIGAGLGEHLRYKRPRPSALRRGRAPGGACRTPCATASPPWRRSSRVNARSACRSLTAPSIACSRSTSSSTSPTSPLRSTRLPASSRPPSQIRRGHSVRRRARLFPRAALHLAAAVRA